MKRMAMVLALAALGGAVVRVQTSLPIPNVIRVVSRADTSKAGVERGRLAYVRYGCAMCHGARGEGGFANPNAETDGKVPGVVYVAEGYTEQELARKILDGVPTVGRADRNGPSPPYRMPGWRDRMTDQEVNDLVRYLMSLYPKSAEQKWR